MNMKKRILNRANKYRSIKAQLRVSKKVMLEIQNGIIEALILIEYIL